MLIKVNDLTINYRISGKGKESVFILQGWGTSLNLYRSLAETFEKKYQVVQFDFPGFGESQEPDEAWDVEKYVDFFLAFSHAIGIEEGILFGHSFGGRVIIRLAARRTAPFNIKKIILAGSAGILPKKTKKQQRAIRRYKFMKKIMLSKLLENFFPDLTEAWKSRQGSQDYRNASPMMRKILVIAVNEDLTDKLVFVTPETLLIWGENDTATPLSDGKLMEEKMPNAGLCVIKEAGHFAFLDKPAEFKKILCSFLNIGE